MNIRLQAVAAASAAASSHCHPRVAAAVAAAAAAAEWEPHARRRGDAGPAGALPTLRAILGFRSPAPGTVPRLLGGLMAIARSARAEPLLINYRIHGVARPATRVSKLCLPPPPRPAIIGIGAQSGPRDRADRGRPAARARALGPN